LRAVEREIESGQFSERGGPTFADAALAYMKAGGGSTYIGKLFEHFGGKTLSKNGQAEIDAAALIFYPGAKSATRNRSVYSPVSAILRYAGIRIGLRRPRGAGGNKQTAWLWPEQAFALIEEAEKLDQEFGALCTVLLYTGMRLSEALGLTWDNTRL